jgi:5'-3' exonuclease
MGIKNINATVKKECPRAFVSIELRSLAGYRIAIDAPLWAYATIASAMKSMVRAMKDPLEEIDRGELLQRCLSQALRFHSSLLSHGISPIWLRDGKTPKEKTATRAKRREVADKRKDEVEELRQKLSTEDIFLRQPQDLERLRSLLQNTAVIHKEEFDVFYSVLEGLGLPLITCPGESEAYASTLNRKGLVYGVWTTDTDCYALGAINMITGFGDLTDTGHETVNIVHIPYMLEDLDFTPEQMLDFCVMCGTDFNDNIPNIGGTRALAHIRNYGSIEQFEAKSKHDCTILNYKKSRRLLTAPQCELEHDSPELSHSPENYYSLGRDISLQYGLLSGYAELGQKLDMSLNVKCYDIESGPLIRRKRRLVLKSKGVPVDSKLSAEKRIHDNEAKITCLADLLLLIK